MTLSESAALRPHVTPAMNQIGGYECLAVLSSGGMGQVLLGRRAGLHGFERLVAIKTIREEFSSDADLRDMFLDEARLMARLVHPAIAQVYDFGEDNHTLYLVMEYVPGVSLRSLPTKLPPLVAARAIKDACLGLHAAHELRDLSGAPLGVVHRDVSPENLMLTFEGAVKILDFGIALVRDRQARETVLGHIKGKPAYMSPEQVNNEPIDRRSDIFSTGIVLHELLTGRQLFTGPSMLALALAITHAEIPRPSTLVPEIPSALDDIVLKALSRDKNSRYDTAASMAADLESVVGPSRTTSLENFAKTELGELHEQHRAWLSRAVGCRTSINVPPVPLEGRPQGVATAIAAEPPEETPRRTPPESLLHNATTRRPVSPKSKTPHARRVWTIGALAIIAVAGAAAVAALSQHSFSAFTSARAASSPLGNCADGLVKPTSFSFPQLIIPQEAPHSPTRTKETKTSSLSSGAAPVPSAPPPSPTPPPVEDGKLTLGATPYAWVRIDGKMVGSTPLFGFALPAGEHQIVLIRPDDGTVRYQETVTIPPGGHKHMNVR